MKGKSLHGRSAEEIRSALSKLMEDGYRPTVAFVFISIKQDRKAVCEILDNEGIDIIGATSVGEFTDEQQSEGGTAILLLDISRDNYTILFEDIGQRNLEDVTANLAQKAFQKFRKSALILCSTLFSKAGTMIDGNTLVKSIESAFGSDIIMFGGMAGDDITFTGTFVF